MRKISTFEIIDGDILKEHLWGYEKEEDVSYYLVASGVDSVFFMFTFGLPLYVLIGSVILAILIPLVNYARYGWPEVCKLS